MARIPVNLLELLRRAGAPAPTRRVPALLLPSLASPLPFPSFPLLLHPPPHPHFRIRPEDGGGRRSPKLGHQLSSAGLSAPGAGARDPCAVCGPWRRRRRSSDGLAVDAGSPQRARSRQPALRSHARSLDLSSRGALRVQTPSIPGRRMRWDPARAGGMN